jgi:hypothetical protein
VLSCLDNASWHWGGRCAFAFDGGNSSLRWAVRRLGRSRQVIKETNEQLLIGGRYTPEFERPRLERIRAVRFNADGIEIAGNLRLTSGAQACPGTCEMSSR